MSCLKVDVHFIHQIFYYSFEMLWAGIYMYMCVYNLLLAMLTVMHVGTRNLHVCVKSELKSQLIKWLLCFANYISTIYVSIAFTWFTEEVDCPVVVVD